MGKVYIVGAGPGDPELITLKALKVLKKADVVLYDALIDKSVLEFAPPTAIKLYVGKREGRHSFKQEEINELLYKYALVYGNVVRLKGGDPFIFGRGGEEVIYLASRGVEVEVIPGVSSVNASAATALVPLTHRGVSSSFTVITGHEPRKINWECLKSVETLVILMGIKNKEEIATALIKTGRDEKEEVVFVEKATTPEEKVIFSNLKEVSEGKVNVETPAVMIVGKVVSLARKIHNLQNCNLQTILSLHTKFVTRE